MADEVSENVLGCGGLIALGAAVWLTSENWPISAYAIATGLVVLGLRRIENALDGEDDASISFRRRLARGLASDSKRVAFWLFAGLAAIWLVQIVLNLFRSNVDPNQVLSAELAVYEFGDQMTELASVSTALIGLAIALLLSIMVSALWPVAALGAFRKFLSAAIVAFAAITSFSFVAVAEASSRYGFVIGPIRAAIVRDLGALAQARQDGAAFQWMAAQFSPDRAEAKPAIRAWQAYFNEAGARCERENVEFRRAYRGQLRQAIVNDLRNNRGSTRSAAPGVPTHCHSDQLVRDLVQQRIPAVRGAVTAARPWLSDFRANLGPPAVGGMLDPAVGDLTLGARNRRLHDLQSLRTAIGSALQRAGAAREAARTIAVDAVTNLLPGSARGVAGVIVDAWKGALVDAMAGQSEARIATRVALLRTGGPGAAGNAELLAERHSPLESPLPERSGDHMIRAAIDREMASLGRPTPATAAAEAVAGHASAFPGGADPIGRSPGHFPTRSFPLPRPPTPRPIKIPVR